MKPVAAVASCLAFIVMAIGGCTPAFVLQSSGPVISLSGVANGAITLVLGVPVTLEASEPRYNGRYTFTVANAGLATLSVPSGATSRRRDVTSTVTDSQGDVTIMPIAVGSTTLKVQTSNASLTVRLTVTSTTPAPTGSGPSASPSSTPAATPTPTAPPPGVLSANPKTLSFYTTGASAAQTVLVQQTNFSGTLSETDTCSGIVTVSPTSSASPYSATVTPVAAGTCTITFSDGTQTAPVAVTVTTAGITVNTKGRIHE